MKITFKKWGDSPESDWQTMFSFFLALLALVIALAALMWSLTSANPVPEEDSATNILSETALHRTALYYDNKQALFDEAKAAPDITPDPSR